jgi:hypothetical protein
LAILAKGVDVINSRYGVGLISFVASFLCMAIVAKSEIPDLNSVELQATATDILAGKVARIYSYSDRSSDLQTTHYVAEIKVKQVDKGKYNEPLVYVRFWRKSYRGPGLAPPGHYGHRNIPTAGSSTRVYLRHAEDGGFDVLSPNGFAVSKTPLTDP